MPRNTARGRGQGSGRARGKGQAVPPSTSPESVLQNNRKQRQVTKRQLSSLDAPPRKRRAQRPSRERQPCQLLEKVSMVIVKEEPGVDLPSQELHIPMVEEVLVKGIQPEEIVIEMEVGSDGRLRAPEPPQDPLTNPVPSTSCPNPISTTTLDSNYESIVMEWLKTSAVESDDDDDMTETVVYNTEDLVMPLQPLRTATEQDADDSCFAAADLAKVYQEEMVSDGHIRTLVMNEDFFDFEWSTDHRYFTGQREVFTGTPGPTFPVTSATRPTDIYYRMFNDSFIDLIVTATNRYANQKLTELRRSNVKNSRLHRWTPTDRDEMITFLSILILQGLYPKVNEESYFSYDGYGTTPYFSRIMSYNRFFLLKTFLQFIDDTKTTDNTKLKKIRPIIDYFNDKFSTLYMPKREIVIDESLLLWMGKLDFSQKMSKKGKVGIKTYELSESQSGYLWRFFVYTGKSEPDRTTTNLKNRQTDDRPTDDNGDGSLTDISRPTNTNSEIVYSLLEPLLYKGHTLTMDSFYNSPLLARCLKRDGLTDVYGTLRLSREFVPETLRKVKASLRQGEAVATYCSDLSAVIWRDTNKYVSMISTYHPLRVGTLPRRSGETIVNKLAIVSDYNKAMGGVDRKDHFLAGQCLERTRNKIWYNKLFRRLFNVALYNCYIIFTERHKIQHRQFRRTLAEDLIKIHKQIDLTTEPRLNFKRPPTVNTTMPLQTKRNFLEENHFPAYANFKKGRCVHCKKARSVYKCEECNVTLCIIGCFKDYHKRDDFFTDAEKSN